MKVYRIFNRRDGSFLNSRENKTLTETIMIHKGE